jgi:hypothetical protein
MTRLEFAEAICCLKEVIDRMGGGASPEFLIRLLNNPPADHEDFQGHRVGQSLRRLAELLRVGGVNQFGEIERHADDLGRVQIQLSLPVSVHVEVSLGIEARRG